MRVIEIYWIGRGDKFYTEGLSPNESCVNVEFGLPSNCSKYAQRRLLYRFSGPDVARDSCASADAIIRLIVVDKPSTSEI